MTISPQDFIYKSAHSEFMKSGYSDRDASNVASEVVRKHRRGKTFKQRWLRLLILGSETARR